MSTETPSTPEFAYTPAPASGRGFGAWSLATAMIAPVLALLLALALFVLSRGGADPWSLLGLFLLGGMVIGVVALVLGVIAVVLGGLAVARRRGRGMGIAGIAIGGLTLLTLAGFAGLNLLGTEF
jgi:hypothetical protein